MTWPSLSSIVGAVVIAAVVFGILLVFAVPVVEMVIRARARRLPASVSERLLEEWLAESSAIDRRWTKLGFAFGLLLAPNKSFVDAGGHEGAPLGLAGKVEIAVDVRAYTDIGDRVIAFILDLVIITIAFALIALPFAFFGQSFNSLTAALVNLVLWLAVNAGAYVYCVLRFGGSPGKVLMKLRIVTTDLNPLTVRHAILRIAPWLPSLVMTAANLVVLSSVDVSGIPAREQARYVMAQYPGWLNPVYSTIVCLVGTFDLCAFLFTHDRRSLRDMIAGTVVVLKAPKAIDLTPAPVKSSSMFR
jgi:uncharacterized RDD family membrane protein YckC